MFRCLSLFTATNNKLALNFCAIFRQTRDMNWKSSSTTFQEVKKSLFFLQLEKQKKENSEKSNNKGKK